MNKYIYARVSTVDQNVDQQVAKLRELYHDAVAYTEKMSGKTCDRPVFNKLKDLVTQNDSIIVYSVSRLGRNTIQVLDFIELMKQRGVSVLVYDLGGIDVTSSMGKLVLTTLAAVAEMQREELLEKQHIGILRAKKEGKFKGKQVSPHTIKKCKKALELVNKGLSKTDAAKTAEVGIATLYRYIKSEALNV